MTTLSTNIFEEAPVSEQHRQHNRGDRIFFGTVTAAVWLVPILVLCFLGVLIVGAWPAIRTFGWSFLGGKIWNTNAENGETYGALPFIWGTAVTGLLALLLAAPIGI